VQAGPRKLSLTRGEKKVNERRKIKEHHHRSRDFKKKRNVPEKRFYGCSLEIGCTALLEPPRTLPRSSLLKISILVEKDAQTDPPRGGGQCDHVEDICVEKKRPGESSHPARIHRDPTRGKERLVPL